MYNSMYQSRDTTAVCSISRVSNAALLTHPDAYPLSSAQPTRPTEALAKSTDAVKY